MKATARSTAFRSLTPTAPSFYMYLKPGALAQLRYSKMSARSREIAAQTLLALAQLELTSNSAGLVMDGIPSFNARVKGYPRCLQRKKLVAVTPFFSETQS